MAGCTPGTTAPEDEGPAVPGPARWVRRLILLGVLFGATQLLTACTPVLTLVVTTTLDTLDATPGDGVCDDGVNGCSLRAAVQEANASPGYDEIVLADGATYALTQTGARENAAAAGDLDVTDSLSIQGNGATIDAGGVDGRVLDVLGGDYLLLEDLTLTGGNATTGGGIRVDVGKLAANHLTVEGNVASSGAGGIAGPGAEVVALQRTTVSGNTGRTAGGVAAGVLRTKHTTISDNAATDGIGGVEAGPGSRLEFTTITANTGGGLTASGASVELETSIVGDQAAGADCAGSVTSLGYNVDSDGTCGLGATGDTAGVSPQLGALVDNGGPTETRIPAPDSPAVNRVPDGIAGCEGMDQRDAARPKTGSCESGAVEVETAEPGSYTLYSYHGSEPIFLVDQDGDIVNRWDPPTPTHYNAYLLPNGNIVRATGDFSIYLHSLEILDWSGNVLWSYDGIPYHHDLAVMPNGHLLVVAWDPIPGDDAVALGRDPATAYTDFPTYRDDLGVSLLDVYELDPNAVGDPVVWQWRSRDHMVQDFDSTLPNYGAPADHPELVDLNWLDPTVPTGDWAHPNGIDYNAEHDQIVISARSFSELWVIDHSTTTAEAAGHTGGGQGKGGDILYRVGNPEAYGRGDAADRDLYFQHDPTWIPTGAPGGYSLQAFNNGRDRPGGDASTVDEFVVPVNPDGSYDDPLPGDPYGPADPAWTWSAMPATSFYYAFISGAQRLANGNTLITGGPGGEIFEVTSTGTEVFRIDADPLVFKARRFLDFDGTMPVPVSNAP